MARRESLPYGEERSSTGELKAAQSVEEQRHARARAATRAASTIAGRSIVATMAASGGHAQRYTGKTTTQQFPWLASDMSGMPLGTGMPLWDLADAVSTLTPATPPQQTASSQIPPVSASAPGLGKKLKAAVSISTLSPTGELPPVAQPKRRRSRCAPRALCGPSSLSAATRFAVGLPAPLTAPRGLSASAPKARAVGTRPQGAHYSSAHRAA